MDKKKFIQLYWKNYIAIDKEFTKTLEYITLDSDNFRAYSGAYIKLLLQIGNEIDITAKLLCRQYNNHANYSKLTYAPLNWQRVVIVGISEIPRALNSLIKRLLYVIK